MPTPEKETPGQVDEARPGVCCATPTIAFSKPDHDSAAPVDIQRVSPDAVSIVDATTQAAIGALAAQRAVESIREPAGTPASAWSEFEILAAQYGAASAAARAFVGELAKRATRS